MKSRKLRMPSPAMIVACMALVLAMAGTSYAAVKINGKNIKNKTISGAKLKNNTITGTQIKESKLKTVPTATNALNLEGTPAAGFARAANFQRVLVSMNVGDPDATLVTNGDISVKARCYVSAGKDYLSIYAATQTNGALLESQEDDADPLNTDTAFDSAELTYDNNSSENTPAAFDGYDDTGFVVNAASTKVITMLEGSKTVLLNRSGKDCTVGAVFIVN